MKVVKSNSKCNYNFSEQSNFCGMSSLKKRIVGDYNPVEEKFNASTDVREPGNSYVEKKDFADKPTNDKNLKPREEAKSDSTKGIITRPGMDSSELKGSHKTIKSRMDLANKWANKLTNSFGKSDFSTDEKCVDRYYNEMSGAMTKDEIRSSGACNQSQKVNNSELEIKGSDLRNKRWRFRHSPTDPQFNAKATLVNSSDKNTGTYNGQKFDTKCRDEAMKLGLDRFQAAAACVK